MSEKDMPANRTEEAAATSTKNAVPADRNQALVDMTARVVMVLAVSLSIYQIYTAGIAALTAMVQRS
ncbi:MAG: hypothetical protein PVI82_06500, partial [Desulfobacterales bacterium]